MLEEGRKIGGTHFAMIDADEVLTGDLLPGIRTQIDCLPPGSCLQIPMRNMYCGIHQYRNDLSIWGSAVTSLAFADAERLSWRPENGYQHHHREPFGSRCGLRIYPTQMKGGLMHMQFASRRRLLAKHALYQVDEVLRWPGRRSADEVRREYSMAPDWNGAQFSPAPREWWNPYRDLMKYLNIDAEPWQEQHVRELVARYGPERFAGLDLFGVVGVAECTEA